MANLKEVRTRIQSVKSTQQITKAMKMVAASKLRKAQDAILHMRPYAQKMVHIIEHAAATIEEDNIKSIFTTEREVKNVLIVVVTSNRGLCGAFNSNIIKETEKLIREEYAGVIANENLWIMPIGKKGYDYFKKNSYQCLSEYFDLFSDLTFENVKQAGEFILEGFSVEKYDRVHLIYNEFKNVATQILRTEQFLPVIGEEDNEGRSGTNTEYIFEPSPAHIIKELIPRTLKINLYKALLESNASEQGARMSAMDQATENAGELLKDLRLVYNRTRQATITTEILEIVGGAEALENG